MASTRSIRLPFTTVYSETTTTAFTPVTAWTAAERVAKLRAEFEVRHRQGALSIQPAYQTCNEPSTVDTSVTFGTAVTFNTVEFAGSFSAVTVDDKKYIRFGWEVKNTSGSNLNLARVAGTVYIQQPG